MGTQKQGLKPRPRGERTSGNGKPMYSNGESDGKRGEVCMCKSDNVGGHQRMNVPHGLGKKTNMILPTIME